MLLAAIVLQLVVASSSGTSRYDPESVVLTASDVPAGFHLAGPPRADVITSGLRNQDWGYQSSAVAGFTNASSDIFIVSGAAVYDTDQGARRALGYQYYINYPARPQVPSAPRLGDESFIFQDRPGYAVVWRRGRIVGLLLMAQLGDLKDMSLDAVTQLARVQDSRMRQIQSR
jgi:hypothetical protein